MEPTTPGVYSYTADMPDAEPAPVEVVFYDGALMARLPDLDEVSLQPVEDLSGTWGAWPANV